MGWFRYLLVLLVGIWVGNLPSCFSKVKPPEVVRNTTSAIPPTLSILSETTSITLDHRANSVATLAEIMLIPGDYAQTVALYNLGAKAAAPEIEKLLKEVSSLHLTSDRRIAGSILYARYAELDSQSAVNFLLDNESIFSDLWLGVIFTAWSRINLDEAVSGAAQLNLVSREKAGVALLTAHETLSHDERLSIIKILGIESVLPQLEMLNYMSMAKSDPQSAWLSAVTSENSQFRTQRLFAVVRVWASSDPQAALAAVATIDPRIRSSLQSQILAQWGKRYPHDAVSWALAQESSVERPKMLTHAFQNLSRSDPQGAMSLAMNLSGDELNVVVGGIVKIWINTDFESAMAWYEGEARNFGNSLVSNISLGYAKQNPREAFDWALSLPADESFIASRNIIAMTSLSAPDLAAEMSMRIVDRTNRMSSAKGTVDSWARSNPVAAGDWIGSIGSIEERTPLYQSLFRRWLRSDGEVAVNYLSQLPNGVERDKIVEKVIMRLNSNPELAERLYGHIETANYRERAAMHMYRILRDKNPIQAEKYRLAAEIEKNQ